MLDIQGIYYDVEPSWRTEKSRGHNTLVYAAEGKVLYFIEDKQLELDKGEVLFIPNNLYRSWTNHPKESHKKYTAVFSWDESTKEIPPLFTDRIDLLRFKPRNIAYFEQRFSFLFLQWLGKRTFFEQLSSSVLTELFLLISQEKSERNPSAVKEPLVRKMQEYILNNYRRSITIEELSIIAGVTPNYVTILFKEVIGSTPIQYLHQIRINTALNLLSKTEMSVKDVAEYLGYCDQSYFNRMFKKWMGSAPSQIKS
ncbi:AraC family transcriptional regulator [Metabacillus idriensis]|uniref:AraC family transcriptional regulator n=1 Tax=Metabacillus idriensis TaxID=324768 RepID=UPI0008A8765E|nr:AraC family transcriptional regulator [Metabacillus idriensis]MCM3596149.1 AraC family transcriptional regulator [Metabacillus idriensis]OHR69528.1 hypothetical protein HMPREF3291_00410 [Bacillus sp. HMSC76G11]